MGEQEPGATIRRAVPSDVGAMLAIARRCLAMGEFPGVTDHELTVGLGRIAAMPETAIVAMDDGDLAGWIIPRQFDLTVAPEHRRRGHATRLVRAALPLAAEDRLPNLRLWAPCGIEGPIAFLRAAGFSYDASLWRMRLPASVIAGDVAFADDVVLRPVRPGEDDVAFVALANAAFAGHPSPVRFTVEGLRFAMAAEGFDPGTVQVLAPAADPARFVGFARIDLDRADGGIDGDVRAIGLLPEWRGRGLGRDLLRWSVAALRRRGAEDVWLSVEAANTAALHLYEAEGFVAEIEWPHWVKPLAD